MCPPRVLDFLLRRFLDSGRGTGGFVVKEKGVELISPRKKGLVTDDVIICKRMRSQCSRLDASLEAKLKSMSGKVYEAYSKPLVEEGIAKKRIMHQCLSSSGFIG